MDNKLSTIIEKAIEKLYEQMPKYELQQERLDEIHAQNINKKPLDTLKNIFKSVSTNVKQDINAISNLIEHINEELGLNDV